MEKFLLIFLVIFFIGLRIYKYKQYRKTAYYKITKNPYSSLDVGQYGEYLIYKELKYFEELGGKFLFNVYLPKPNNKTTEIDIIFICQKGVFVIESKNFSGWIFGDENNRNWVQTLPAGRWRSQKNYFYNPIMQNANHIKHLKAVVEINAPIHSVVVFSNRCTLMDIKLRSLGTVVLNLCNLRPYINEFFLNTESQNLSEAEIDNIYAKIFPYTQINY